MPVLSTIGASTAKAYGLRNSIIVPGNSGILTSGTSFRLPATSGTNIKVLVIASGGGGGGGTGRTYESGYYTGGGGGGAGGYSYVPNVISAPGEIITYFIGPVGAAGVHGDGIYRDATNGSIAGQASVTVRGVLKANASGGAGGLGSPNATPGSAGAVITGGYISGISPTAGVAAVSGNTAGGHGAKGYQINTTVGASLSSILTYGSEGTSAGQNSGVTSTSGTIYGAGGTGGGCSQSDVYNYANIFATNGTTGAVFIWWGY